MSITTMTLLYMPAANVFLFPDVSNLSLSLLGSNEFHIAWDTAHASGGFSVDAYNITVVNQHGEVLHQKSLEATSESGMLHYTYASEESHSEFSECSRLVFSVAVIAGGRSSWGSNVSWSGPGKGELLIVIWE
jgi:hypothetical protein